MNIVNSTTSDNYADHDSGGIRNEEILTIISSDITGNTASQLGGGGITCGDDSILNVI